ncbi:hypothetical protein [Rathayibacter sp. VKM Ac-2801]|uniref:hypothetical protein n=1 Tax=Rathayibacter sp. VKM Ac-2801 TaxID=2609255 RepID=UPI00131FBD11|nr:hypothetical protein [Rathayibacter sp. VKM Ac-2801]QHC70944.1 hypothetical protein GSU45_11570 [Rathayibacter sp. VKM Ac-2801]
MNGRKKLATGLSTLAVASGLVLGITMPASATSTPRGTSASTEQYTDRDVVALLIDGSGPIAEANPDVATGIGFVNGEAGVSGDVIDEVTQALVDNVPSFNSTVTQPVTSGNPYQVERGLFALEEGLNSIATVVNSGEAIGYCAVNPVVAVDVVLLAANAAAYENGALWRNNAFWLASAGTSQFSVQNQSALIASNV